MAKPVIWKKGAKGQLTVEQKQLIAAFEDMLIKAAADAGRRLGALTVESAGRFGVKLEERFMSSSSKSHRFYRASVGSSIERMVYTHLPKWVTSMDPQPSSEGWSGIYTGKIGTSTDIVPVTFAIEYTKSGGGLPCTYNRSRPDIRLVLGKGTDSASYEALFDLTSEGQAGHILKKGDAWMKKANVAYIAEIIWMNDDIMHL